MPYRVAVLYCIRVPFFPKTVMLVIGSVTFHNPAVKCCPALVALFSLTPAAL